MMMEGALCVKKWICAIAAASLALTLSACNMNGNTGAADRNDNGTVNMNQNGQNGTLERARNFNKNSVTQNGQNGANRSYMDNSYTQDRVYGNDVHLHGNSRLET